jgi:adenylate kinase
VFSLLLQHSPLLRNSKFNFFVGKGSFGKLIAQRTTEWAHLSLGEYMRKEISKQTALGADISLAVAEGRLVPDKLANELLKKILNEYQQQRKKVIILDGYPRTIHQAEYLKENFPTMDFSAVHIMLERWVAIQKTLGRQSCVNCGGSFNSSDIRTHGFFMPALVPNPATCPLKEHCNPVFEKRSDDTRELAEVRYNEYLLKTSPLLEWYGSRNLLKSFEVKKGIADVDLLLKTMLSDQVIDSDDRSMNVEKT